MLFFRCVGPNYGSDRSKFNKHKGIFSTLFFTALWVLLKKSSTGRASRHLVIIVCSMYLLAITVSSGDN
jgi:hypothetical protein